MSKKKNKTRAYKEGCTDARNNNYNNKYAEGSTRYDDYERGYSEALKQIEGRGVTHV